MRITDAAHLGLMLSALALTYLVPFELLLLAYVVLGPAHYATEISWLHDRKYFLPQRAVALGLAAVAVVAAIIDNATWFGFVMWAAFVVCVLMAAATTAMQAMVLFIGAMGLTALMLSQGASLAVLGILLPTLIHVSLFTLVFMALGAYRSGQKVQWVLIATYRADPRHAADGRDAGAVVRQGGARLFCQCCARARAAVRDTGAQPRQSARCAARLRLHLSLPQLVHQSRGDPLESDDEVTPRDRGVGERRIDRAVFL
jgi:hypothetical protein